MGLKTELKVSLAALLKEISFQPYLSRRFVSQTENVSNRLGQFVKDERLPAPRRPIFTLHRQRQLPARHQWETTIRRQGKPINLISAATPIVTRSIPTSTSRLSVTSRTVNQIPKQSQLTNIVETSSIQSVSDSSISPKLSQLVALLEKTNRKSVIFIHL